MRVLIISQYFWPESFRINDLAVGLRDRGHEVMVLTGLPNYPGGQIYPGYGFSSREDDYQGVAVRRVPILARGNARGWRLLANYVSFALMASLLGPVRCDQRADVILVFEPSPITVALPALVMKCLYRVPILFWVQDLWPETLVATQAVRSPWILRQVDRFVRHVYRRCDRVLVQSTAFTTYVEAQGVPRDRIHYFPNCSESIFRPLPRDQAREESAELPPGFRILFAGNIGVSQSFDTILDAAELTRHEPKIQWVVLGDGRERVRIEAEVRRRRLGATVHLPGSRPVETMPRYYAAADALLVSLKREPIFALTIPSKVQSYLACGKPILASLDGEGARIVAESGAGIVAPAEDSAALARAALELFSRSEVQLAQMGAHGREYFERHFDRDRLLGRLESWMSEVTEDRRCAA